MASSSTLGARSRALSTAVSTIGIGCSTLVAQASDGNQRPHLRWRFTAPTARCSRRNGHRGRLTPARSPLGCGLLERADDDEARGDAKVSCYCGSGVRAAVYFRTSNHRPTSARPQSVSERPARSGHAQVKAGEAEPKPQNHCSSFSPSRRGTRCPDCSALS